MIGDRKKNSKIEWCVSRGGESRGEWWRAQDLSPWPGERRKRSVGPRSREDPCTPSGSAMSVMVKVIITTTIITSTTATIMRAVNCY